MFVWTRPNVSLTCPQGKLESMILDEKDQLEKKLQDEIDGRRVDNEQLARQIENDVKGLQNSIDDGVAKIGAVVDEEKNARDQCYKTFFVCNLRIFVIS